MNKSLETIFSVVAAVILLQTLFFKFTGSEESIYIFTKVGIEPFGRYLTGIVELIAVIALIIPKSRLYGSILGLGVISGAILSHLTILGIEVMNDGGLLCGYAVIVFLIYLIIIINRRKEIPIIGSKLS
jgi:uncharacterized membrane protein YphA (DoxX/SURF4 family)